MCCHRACPEVACLDRDLPGDSGDVHPASIRAVCYQLFIQGRLPSMAKKHTNRVITTSSTPAKRVSFPWRWIVDETRDAERAGTWASADEYPDDAALLPERSLAPAADAGGSLVGKRDHPRHAGAVLEHFGLTFRVIHGPPVGPSRMTPSGLCRGREALPHPLRRDHDPSGRHMSDVDLPENRFQWEQEQALDPTDVPSITLTRLAIDPTDPTQAALPSFPASDKQADSRYRWFVDRYGDTCWELDAMNPNDLRTLVQQAIEAQIDWDAWLRAEAVETAENRSMRDFLAQWTALHSGKTGQAR